MVAEYSSSIKPEHERAEHVLRLRQNPRTSTFKKTEHRGSMCSDPFLMEMFSFKMYILSNRHPLQVFSRIAKFHSDEQFSGKKIIMPPFYDIFPKPNCISRQSWVNIFVKENRNIFISLTKYYLQMIDINHQTLGHKTHNVCRQIIKKIGIGAAPIPTQ